MRNMLATSTKAVAPHTKVSRGRSPPKRDKTSAMKPRSMRPVRWPGSGAASRVRVRASEKSRIAGGALHQLVAEDHVVEHSRGIDEDHPDLRRNDRAVAEHRDQRHDAGAASDEKDRATVVTAPVEVAADRAAHLDGVAGLDDLVEERRDLAVVELLDDELDRVAARCRADRIAALCLVPVRRGEADVDMLARNEPAPLRRLQKEALYRRCLRDDGGYRRLLPGDALDRWRRRAHAPASCATAPPDSSRRERLRNPDRRGVAMQTPCRRRPPRRK